VPVLGRNSEVQGRRRAATEARITGATRDLLEEGFAFADLNIEQIASRAGISRTAFYDYFRDKRDLLMRLVEEATAPILREADELVGGRPSGPDEIPHTIAAAVEFSRNERQVFRATVEAAAYDPVIRAFWQDQVLGRFVDVIERRIEGQQERQIALAGNARGLALSLVMMVVATLYQHASHDVGMSDDEVAETLVAVAVRAVYGDSAQT
jgi:AcrR family transcriptional regulator